MGSHHAYCWNDRRGGRNVAVFDFRAEASKLELGTFEIALVHERDWRTGCARCRKRPLKRRVYTINTTAIMPRITRTKPPISMGNNVWLRFKLAPLANSGAIALRRL